MNNNQPAFQKFKAHVGSWSNPCGRGLKGANSVERDQGAEK